MAFRRTLTRLAFHDEYWAAYNQIALTDAAKAYGHKMRSLATEELGLHSKYSAPPAEIDWKGYAAKVKDKAVIDAMKKSHAQKLAAIPAPVTSEVLKGQLSSEHADDMIQAKELSDWAKSQYAMTEELINFLSSKKTTYETTVGDVLAMYPDIEKEIDQEIHNHEWLKDVDK